MVVGKSSPDLALHLEVVHCNRRSFLWAESKTRGSQKKKKKGMQVGP